MKNTIQFLNELASDNTRYKRVSEESIPSQYYTSRDIAKKFGMNHRVCQRKLSEYLLEEKLEVIWARRRVSVVAVRKMPCYKFKKKSYEKSFKG